MQGRRLSRPRWLLHTEMVYPPITVTHPSTNWAWRRVTSLMSPMTLPLC